MILGADHPAELQADDGVDLQVRVLLDHDTILRVIYILMFKLNDLYNYNLSTIIKLLTSYLKYSRFSRNSVIW